MLSALRTATAARHEALDSTLPIGRVDATPDDYRHHLLMLHTWLAPIEAWLACFDDGPQDCAVLPSKRRLDLIEADLGDAVPGRGEPGNMSLDASAAYRWGVCYVIEGSQLGGTVLYQRLREQLAPHPLRYLKGEPEGPGPRWRAFTQSLKAQVTTPQQIADACQGACDAFDRILALR